MNLNGKETGTQKTDRTRGGVALGGDGRDNAQFAANSAPTVENRKAPAGEKSLKLGDLRVAGRFWNQLYRYVLVLAVGQRYLSGLAARAELGDFHKFFFNTLPGEDSTIRDQGNFATSTSDAALDTTFKSTVSGEPSCNVTTDA